MASENDSIIYHLTRTSRKNINITIKNDGLVYVSAPKYVSLSEINRVVYSRRDWILEAQKNIKHKTVIKSDAPIRNGAIVYLYGTPLKLKVIPSVSNSIKVVQNELLFYVKKENIEDQNYKHTEFNKLLKKEIQKTVTKYIEKYLELTGLALEKIEVRMMKARWGTCIPAKKKIIMNYHLVHCPKEAIEYVALHEVTHLMHPNHSKRFYDSIALYMPDWKERKEILQDYCII
ncbi:MAG: M48 family metallopeptidase [Clostridia bacterium]|nr:M48 family metallopeptidase [Clostridia bacterium]